MEERHTKVKETNDGYMIQPFDLVGNYYIIPVRSALGINAEIYMAEGKYEVLSVYADAIPDKLRDILYEIIDESIISLRDRTRWSRSKYTRVRVKVNIDIDSYQMTGITEDEYDSLLANYDYDDITQNILRPSLGSYINYMVTCIYVRPSRDAVTISIKPTNDTIRDVEICEVVREYTSDDDIPFEE